MSANRRARRRWLIAGFVLFAAFIFGASGAYSRYERIVYGALQLGLALICFGMVAWLAGRDIASRESFTWRGIDYRGSKVPFFGRMWMLFAIAYWLLGASVILLWLFPSLTGARRPGWM